MVFLRIPTHYDLGVWNMGIRREILKQIKQEEPTKAIPVIILSNLGQKEEIERGMNLGANDYLVKAHFTPDEIIEKINKVLK